MNAAAAVTFEIHHAAGQPFYVIEHRHDGEVNVSTGSPLRCVAGPYLEREQAVARKAELEAEQVNV